MLSVHCCAPRPPDADASHGFERRRSILSSLFRLAYTAYTEDGEDGITCSIKAVVAATNSVKLATCPTETSWYLEYSRGNLVFAGHTGTEPATNSNRLELLQPQPHAI